MAVVMKRSRLSMAAALSWVLICVVLSAALKPNFIGTAGLLAVTVIGAGVLWSFDAIAAAWREDRDAKRDQRMP